MTVGELIQELKYMDEGATVRFASQPSWPFEYSIYGVVPTIVEGKENSNLLIVDQMNLMFWSCLMD